MIPTNYLQEKTDILQKEIRHLDRDGWDYQYCLHAIVDMAERIQKEAEKWLSKLEGHEAIQKEIEVEGPDEPYQREQESVRLGAIITNEGVFTGKLNPDDSITIYGPYEPEEPFLRAPEEDELRLSCGCYEYHTADCPLLNPAYEDPYDSPYYEDRPDYEED